MRLFPHFEVSDFVIEDALHPQHFSSPRLSSSVTVLSIRLKTLWLIVCGRKYAVVWDSAWKYVCDICLGGV